MGKTIEASLEKMVPGRYEWKVWLLAAFLLLIGCILSFTYHDWIWLSRLGAVMTVLAMAVASFNTHAESKIVLDELNKAFGKELWEGIEAQIRKRPHLYGICRPLNEEEYREVIEKELIRQTSVMELELKQAMIEGFKALELRVAAIGAFVWGFADLLNLLRC